MIETTTQKPKDPKTEKRGLPRLRFSVFQFLGFSVLLLAFLGVWSPDAEAVLKCWIANGASGSFTDNTKWSTICPGGPSNTTAPGPNDTASFNSNSSNADVQITTDINVDGFWVSSTYAGDLVISPGITMTLGDGDNNVDGFSYEVTGGTLNLPAGMTMTVTGTFRVIGVNVFHGNNANITVGDYVTLQTPNTTGTSITLPSGTFRIGGSFGWIAQTKAHNNGTVIFEGAGDSTSMAMSGSLYNVTIDKSTDTACATVPTMASGTLTLTNGRMESVTGGSSARGPVVVGSTFDGGCTAGTLLKVDGSFQSFTVPSGARLPATTVNGLSNAVTLNGTVTFDGNVSVTLGTVSSAASQLNLTINGGLTVNGGAVNLSAATAGSTAIATGPVNITLGSVNLGSLSTVALSGTVNFAGGTFTLPSGILTLSGATITAAALPSHNNGTVNFTGASTIDVPAAGLTLNHVTFSPPNAAVVTIASGDTLTVAGNLTFADGLVNTGTIKAQGNVVVEAGADGGTAKLWFTGTTDQTYTNSGGVAPTGDFVVNKTSGTLSVTNPDITISAQFILQAGTFTAASGTTSFASNFVVNSGTFNHNNGTVIMTGTGTILMPGSGTALNHLTFNAPAGTGPTIDISGGDLVVDGTLTLQEGILDGAILMAKGPINVAATFDGGGATLFINGAGDQSFAIPIGAVMPMTTLNQAATTISFAGSDGAFSQRFTLNVGTFMAASGTTSFAGGLTVSGGTFNHNNGTISFTGAGTIDVPPAGLTLNHVTFSPPNAAVITIASGDTLTATGNLTFADGLVNTGTIAAQGNVVVGAGADVGTAAVQLTGTTDQTITQAVGGIPPGGSWTINKTAGIARLLSALSLNTGGQSLTIAANNTLDLNNFPLTINRTLTNNGTIIASGAGTPLTIGGSALNIAGTITFTGNAADGPVTVGAVDSGTLIFDNPGTTFTLGGPITAQKDLTISAGSTLDASAEFSHQITLGQGNLAGAGGRWFNTGTFIPRSGTVLIQSGAGIKDHTITGTNTFYNLTMTISSAHGSANLILPAGIETTVSNSLSLQGANTGNRLNIRSSTPGTPARLTLPAGKTQSLLYLDVMDSDASGGQQLVTWGSANSGNNTNWSINAEMDLVSGLVGHWKLDNDAADSTGSNNGTASNVTYPATPAATPTGNTHAGDFDGSTSYIDLGANVNLPSGAMTIAAWVKADSFPVDDVRIISKASSTNEQDHWWMLGTVGDGGGNRIARFRLKTGSDPASGTTTMDTNLGGDILTTGAWYHLTAAYDGAWMRLYINGILEKGGLKSGTVATSGSVGANIGRNPDGYGEWDGLIDDVRLYNRALTQAEIESLAGTTNTGSIRLKDADTGDVEYTNSTTVDIEFSSLEPAATLYGLCGASSVGCAAPNVAIPSLPSFTTTATLTDGDGVKSYVVRIDKGIIYNISDTIVLDTTPPAAPTNLTLTAGADSTSMTATATAPADATSLVFRYSTVNGNNAPVYPATSTAGTAFAAGTTTGLPSAPHSLTATSLTPLKTYGVAVWAKDAAGNASSAPVQQFLYLSPPTPRLVITAPNNATTGPAGTALTLTITAKDADGNLIPTYAGPSTLTWTPSGGSASALTTGAWVNGSTTASATIGGANAGPGTLTAVDTSGSELTNGTLGFTFYPASFTVASTQTSLTASETFPLTITAKDAAGATTTRYAGTVALFAVYVNPPMGGRDLSLTSVPSASFVSGAATANLHYPDAGQIQILARDTTYVPGVTIQGTSATLAVKPKSFGIKLMPLPASLTKPYVSQPFDIEVTALAADGSTVAVNYTGTVTLTGEGFSLNPMTQTFVPAAHQGRALIKGLKTNSAGTGQLKAAEGAVSGQVPFGARAANLVLNSITGQPGALTVTAYIKDTGTGLPVAEDSSTKFTITLANDTGNAEAFTSSTGPFTLSQGAAAFPVSKSTEGSVTVTGSVLGFEMPAQPASVVWSLTASTSSATTLQVLQFEQAAGSTTLTTPPPATTPGLTNTFNFVPPPLTPGAYSNTYPGFLPTTLAPGAAMFTPPDMSTFTVGGTRYDSAVSMAYQLVAPTATFGRPDGFQGFIPGPMQGKMAQLAQSWKDAGRLNTAQFDAMMGGIQTGRKPEGADALFGPEMGQTLHQEFGGLMQQQMLETGPMMPMMDFGMGEGGLEGSMPPAWLMGPGSEGMEDAPLIFDFERGGWLREGADSGDFSQDEAEEGEEGDEAIQDTEETDGSEESASPEPSADPQ